MVLFTTTVEVLFTPMMPPPFWTIVLLNTTAFAVFKSAIPYRWPLTPVFVTSTADSSIAVKPINPPPKVELDGSPTITVFATCPTVSSRKTTLEHPWTIDWSWPVIITFDKAARATPPTSIAPP